MKSGSWNCPICNYNNYLNIEKCNKCKKKTRYYTENSTEYIENHNSDEVRLSNLSRTKRREVNDICSICYQHNADSGFLHENSVHTGICFLCAVQTKEQNEICPFCRKNVDTIVKVY